MRCFTPKSNVLISRVQKIVRRLCCYKVVNETKITKDTSMKTIFIITIFIFSITMSSFGQTKENTNQLDSIIAHNMLWKPFDEKTIGVQAACGLGLAGTFITAYAMRPKVGDASGVGAGLAALFVSTFGSIAIPTGVYYSGKWMGGTGGWWYTVGGTILGGGTVGPLLALLFAPHGHFIDIAVAIAVGALGGGIAAYHLSATPIYETNVNSTYLPKSPLNNERRMCSLPPNIYQQSFQVTVLFLKF